MKLRGIVAAERRSNILRNGSWSDKHLAEVRLKYETIWAHRSSFLVSRGRRQIARICICGSKLSISKSAVRSGKVCYGTRCGTLGTSMCA